MPILPQNPRLPLLSRSLVWTASLALLASLAAPARAEEPKPHYVEGFSDMVKVGKADYLVVYDRKSNKPDAPRIARVTVKKEGLVIVPIAVTDWKHADGPSNDLETLCLLPSGDFLAAESGTREGQFGRLFRFGITDDKAEIKKVYAEPRLRESTKEGKGDDFEGLVCAPTGDKILLVFGERGGSKPYPQGFVRWGWLDLTQDTVSYPAEGLAGLELKLPGPWNRPEEQRDVGALFLDKSGNLWTVATEDAGDSGPFRSEIIKIGRVDPSQKIPVILQDPVVGWVVDGFKIEALAESYLEGSPLAFGTEDEDLGGAIRPLFPPLQ